MNTRARFDSLPADVLHLIFSFIKTSSALSPTAIFPARMVTNSARATFLSLATTSRSLLPLARQFLYADPLVNVRAGWTIAIGLFRSLQEHDGTLGRLVRVLSILPTWLDTLSNLEPATKNLAFQVRGQTKAFSWFLAMLKACPSLKEVGLVFGNSPQLNKVHTALSPSLPTIKNISLEGQSSVAMKIGVVHRFFGKLDLQGLEELEVRSVHGMEPDRAPSLPFTLNALVVDLEAEPLSSLDQLLPAQNCSLTSLAVFCDVYTSTQVMHLVNLVGASLKHLSIVPQETYYSLAYASYGFAHTGPVLSRELFSLLPNVEHLDLPHAQALSVNRIDTLSRHSRSLRSLTCNSSLWMADTAVSRVDAEWQASLFPQTKLANLFLSFPYLEQLDLGFVPCHPYDSMEELKKPLERINLPRLRMRSRAIDSFSPPSTPRNDVPLAPSPPSRTVQLLIASSAEDVVDVGSRHRLLLLVRLSADLSGLAQQAIYRGSTLAFPHGLVTWGHSSDVRNGVYGIVMIIQLLHYRGYIPGTRRRYRKAVAEASEKREAAKRVYTQRAEWADLHKDFRRPEVPDFVNRPLLPPPTRLPGYRAHVQEDEEDTEFAFHQDGPISKWRDMNGWRLNSAVLVLIVVACSIVWGFVDYNRRDTSPAIEKAEPPGDPKVTLGWAFGWTGLLFYQWPRASEIQSIVQKKSMTISVWLFAFLIGQNINLLISIFSASTTHDSLIGQLPFITNTGIALLCDVCFVAAYFHFRKGPSQIPQSSPLPARRRGPLSDPRPDPPGARRQSVSGVLQGQSHTFHRERNADERSRFKQVIVPRRKKERTDRRSAAQTNRPHLSPVGVDLAGQAADYKRMKELMARRMHDPEATPEQKMQEELKYRAWAHHTRQDREELRNARKALPSGELWPELYSSDSEKGRGSSSEDGESLDEERGSSSEDKRPLRRNSVAELGKERTKKYNHRRYNPRRGVGTDDWV
ncbi:hypothetical protein JCM11641_005293 [Rhodosporidiobolus odoratus]